MKRITFILSVILLLCSCGKEAVVCHEGYLSIGRLATVKRVQTKAVEDDLAIRILTEDGTPVEGCSYSAGEVPARIPLTPGSYIVEAFTENLSTWKDDKGELAFIGSKTFEIIDDETTNVVLIIPAINYIIRAEMPENFSTWFTDWSVTLSDGERTVNINEGEAAVFDNESISIYISATNTDNESYTGNKVNISGLAAGHAYTIKYSFAADGKIDVEINIDEDFSDGGNEDITITE